MFKKATTIAGIITLGTALPLAALSVANADTTTTTNQIPRALYRQERQDAVASVLGTNVAQVQAAEKTKSLDTLVTKDGLTKKIFHQKVRAELKTELEQKGYTQAEINQLSSIIAITNSIAN